MDQATLQTRITETEDALHALMSGQREVEITGTSGKKVSYQQSSMGDLKAYLLWLKGQVTGGARQPIFFGFGR